VFGQVMSKLAEIELVAGKNNKYFGWEKGWTGDGWKCVSILTVVEFLSDEGYYENIFLI